MQLFVWFTPSVSPTARQPSLLRRATPVGTRSPYSLPFVILPVSARSPFRFIRHWRRSTPNPGRGAFWHSATTIPKLSPFTGDSSRARPVGALGSNPPHAVAPFGALYKLIHKQQRGRIASPYLHNLLCSPAARRISHCASNISLRISAISPVRKNGFHRGRKPPTSPFLPGQRSGSRRPPRCRW